MEKFIDYITKFFNSHYDEYRTNYIEYKPQNGYGQYYKCDKITQSIADIFLNIQEEFNDLRIPEHFSSPRHLIGTFENFKKLLIENKKLYEEAFQYYEKQSLPIPPPILAADKMNNEVLEAVNFAFTFIPTEYVQNSVSKNIDNIERIINHFGIIARCLENNRRKEKGTKRETISIKDEYDVQDLLHALLLIDFEDVRTEEWCPSYAGGSKRTDFLLKNEQIFIETKMTRPGLQDKVLGEQLIIDIANYENHPNCKLLYCFIYDPMHYIKNPVGIKNDLEKKIKSIFTSKSFICKLTKQLNIEASND